jgi:hypothetical protein
MAEATRLGLTPLVGAVEVPTEKNYGGNTVPVYQIQRP